jgi:hypothetical protein
MMFIRQLVSSLSKRPHKARNPEEVFNKVLEYVLSDMHVAAECVYALPMRQAGEIRHVYGASVRLAEILSYHWQDLYIWNTVVADYGDKVLVRSIGYDAVTNRMYMVENFRSVVNSHGQRYPEDLVNKVTLAAQKIAERDVIFTLIPASMFINRLVARIRARLLSDANALDDLFKSSVEKLKEYKVSIQQMASAVNAPVVNGKYSFDNAAKLKVIEIANAIEELEVSPETVASTAGNGKNNVPAEEQAIQAEEQASQASVSEAASNANTAPTTPSQPPKFVPPASGASQPIKTRFRRRIVSSNAHTTAKSHEHTEISSPPQQSETHP